MVDGNRSLALLFNHQRLNHKHFSMADLVSHPDEVKVVSRRFGQGATDIDRYLELDGYKAVEKALAMEPDAIINEVKNSALRGRGGAGFNTGLKWSFVPKQSAKPKYILCNGDESEPGTCKDRLIFEHDPHAVIEGTMIAGLAVGAQAGYIYIRGEYRYLLEITQKAIADAYAKGFLGRNIFGSGRDFEIYWHGGAGAYEVGEESALMESLEGKRGIPRIRPPFPAVVGLWGGPTVINNAETLASVPHIILGGAEWYANLGPPKNGGPRLAYHSAPPRIMWGTLASVSALLITVGPPHSPTTAGKGGRIRGIPRLPSSDSISADSSPTS